VRPILSPPRAQQDGLLVERQLQLRPALDVLNPEALCPVDPVQRGPFRAGVLEGVDMGVKVEHGLRFYTPFSVWTGTPSAGIPAFPVRDPLHPLTG